MDKWFIDFIAWRHFTQVIKLHGLLLYVFSSVWEVNPQAVASGLSPVQTQNKYFNLLIAPVCIGTFCIARYFMLNIEISMKGGISPRINFFII